MHRRRFASLVVLPAAAYWLAASTASAQSADPKLRLSLKGYDPVAYFTAGQPTEGKDTFEMAFDGARYRFASAENMTLFKGDPDKYAPQFSGTCANGLSKGLKVEANPLLWKIVDGKLYVFAGRGVPDQMGTDPAPLIEKAQANWKVLQDRPYQ
jgi:YHS domain-containing protein